MITLTVIKLDKVHAKQTVFYYLNKQNKNSSLKKKLSILTFNLQ